MLPVLPQLSFILAAFLCFGAFILCLLKHPFPKKVILNKNDTLKYFCVDNEEVKSTRRKPNTDKHTVNKVKFKCYLPLLLLPETCTQAH